MEKKFDIEKFMLSPGGIKLAKIISKNVFDVEMSKIEKNRKIYVKAFKATKTMPALYVELKDADKIIK